MVSSVASTTSSNSSASSPPPSVDGSARSANKGSGAAKPMPMAIMRNAHEVIRGAMKEIQECINKEDFESGRDLWHKFHRFSDLHMKMEEGRKGHNAKGLFGLVDEHGEKAAKKAHLRDHHRNLYELEEDVVDIFERAPDIDRAKEVYPIFREENESHLKEEEDILMPAIQKMIKGGVPVKKLIQAEIIPLLLMDEGDMEFFIRFSNQILQGHEDGNPRVRVWNHALWAVATSEQWKEWNVWIKETLSEEKYNEVDFAIHAYKTEQRAKKEAKKAAKLEKETPPVTDITTGPRSRSNSPKRFFTNIFSKA